MNPVLRLIIADDDELLLTSLAQILELHEDLSVVGLARDGQEAVNLARKEGPDIALVDLDMPRMDGIEVANALRDSGTAVVIVTRHARPAHLQRALAAGARGFIVKSTSSERLAHILRDVVSGPRYIDPEIATLALTMKHNPLTDRECQVLALVHAGSRVSEVAEELHLAPGTVRNYLSTAMSRLGATTGRNAAAVAYTEGWI